MLDYAITARPLSDLLKGNREFSFSTAQEETFNKLKVTLMSEPVLQICRSDAITELYTDASKLGYLVSVYTRGEKKRKGRRRAHANSKRRYAVINTPR